jgi:hypothetical protein
VSFDFDLSGLEALIDGEWEPITDESVLVDPQRIGFRIHPRVRGLRGRVTRTHGNDIVYEHNPGGTQNEPSPESQRRPQHDPLPADQPNPNSHTDIANAIANNLYLDSPAFDVAHVRPQHYHPRDIYRVAQSIDAADPFHCVIFEPINDADLLD